MQAIIDAVQKNSDIADARHARDYSLCTYLLKMREFYRWHKGLDFTASLSSETIGQWIEAKEALWQSLEAEDFVPIPLKGQRFDPFDYENINRQLVPRSLLYGSGYGRFGRPVFFLAELLRVERLGDCTLFVAGKEYARELSAPPAMAQGKTLLVRSESVKRMLWEKIEEGEWRGRHAPLQRAMAEHAFSEDASKALEKMTESVIEDIIIPHEMGEAMAGEILGEAWDAMLMAMTATQGEIMARAARDHLADCLWTLPRMLERRRSGAIHAYFAMFSAVQKALFPALFRAYKAWMASRDLTPLEEAVERGRTHWMTIAQRATELHRLHGTCCAPHVEALIRENAL